jgi:hypothetical protein
MAPKNVGVNDTIPWSINALDTQLVAARTTLLPRCSECLPANGGFLPVTRAKNAPIAVIQRPKNAARK